MWYSHLTPGHISRENHNYTHPNAHSSNIYNSQDMGTTQMSTDRWIEKKMWYIYIPLRHRKEWNNAIYSNMDGPRDDHTKWSHTKTNIIWYHLHVDLKCDTVNLPTEQNRLTDIENRLVVAKEEGRWGTERLGIWDYQTRTIINTMDKQQGPTIYHKEL